MTDQPTYTLEQAAEARRHLIRTVAEVLTLAPQDLEDTFGKGERIEQGDFRMFDLNDKRIAGRIAEMMVDRLLAWPEEVTIFPTPGVDMEVDPISRQGMEESPDAGWRVPTEIAYDFPSAEPFVPGPEDEPLPEAVDDEEPMPLIEHAYVDRPGDNFCKLCGHPSWRHTEPGA